MSVVNAMGHLRFATIVASVILVHSDGVVHVEVPFLLTYIVYAVTRSPF